MKRDLLLFIAVMLVAAVATFVLLATAEPGGKPLACFMHGGSSTGVCR